MGGERPSKRRREAVRAEGVVPHGPLLTWVAAAAAVVGLVLVAGAAALDGWRALAVAALADAGRAQEPGAALASWSRGLEWLLWALVPCVLVAGLAAMLAGLAQAGAGWNPEALWPRLSRLRADPRPEGQRVGLALRATLGGTLGGLGALACWRIWRAAARLDAGEGALAAVVSALIDLGWHAALALALAGLGDWGLARWRWRRRLSPDPAQARREAREQGRDPLRRQRLRQARAEGLAGLEALGRARLVLVDATPASCAVALAWDSRGPLVVASGRGRLGRLLEEGARARGLALWPDETLARALVGLEPGQRPVAGLREALDGALGSVRGRGA